MHRGRCTGIMLEVFLGHVVFAAMLVRPSLSCFHSCYRFVQAHYGEGASLWPSVIDEPKAFKGLLPMLHCDWGTPWSGFVTFTDTSEYGWGIVTGHLDPAVVARHGRVKERSRWKHDAELAPRATALAMMKKERSADISANSFANVRGNDAEFDRLVAQDGSPHWRFCRWFSRARR